MKAAFILCLLKHSGSCPAPPQSTVYGKASPSFVSLYPQGQEGRTFIPATCYIHQNPFIELFLMSLPYAFCPVYMYSEKSPGLTKCWTGTLSAQICRTAAVSLSTGWGMPGMSTK